MAVNNDFVPEDAELENQDEIMGANIGLTGWLKQFGTAKELIARYTHCQFCGANLHFSHTTDFRNNCMQEMAKCPECGLKAHSTTHRLQ